MTFNEHGLAMLQMASNRRDEAYGQDAALRDLSIAITHLEDALTRYNSACYRMAGTWKRADPEK